MRMTRKEYELDPKTCLNCSTKIDFIKRINKFCSQSCAATFSNINRGSQTAETKKLIGLALKGRSKYEKRFCNKCNTKIKHNNKSGFCKNCLTKYNLKIVSDITKKKLSLAAKLRYKLNPEKHPNIRCAKILESYPEKYFRLILETHGLMKGIDFIMQYDKIKPYYIDFYFPKLNLGVEIDGEQWHDRNNSKEIERENKIKEQIKLKRFWSKPLIKKEYEIEIHEIINKIHSRLV